MRVQLCANFYKYHAIKIDYQLKHVRRNTARLTLSNNQ
jgi:hypothetical protein